MGKDLALTRRGFLQAAGAAITNIAPPVQTLAPFAAAVPSAVCPVGAGYISRLSQMVVELVAEIPHSSLSISTFGQLSTLISLDHMHGIFGDEILRDPANRKAVAMYLAERATKKGMATDDRNKMLHSVFNVMDQYADTSSRQRAIRDGVDMIWDGCTWNQKQAAALGVDWLYGTIVPDIIDKTDEPAILKVGRWGLFNDWSAPPEFLLKENDPATQLLENFRRSPIGKMHGLFGRGIMRIGIENSAWPSDAYFYKYWLGNPSASELGILHDMHARVLALAGRLQPFAPDLHLVRCIEEIHNPASLERVLTGKSAVPRHRKEQAPENKSYRKGTVAARFLAATALSGTILAPQDRCVPTRRIISPCACL